MTECQFHAHCGGSCETPSELEHSLCKLCLEDHEVESALPTATEHGQPVGWQMRRKTDRPDSQWTPWGECCATTYALHSAEAGRFNRFGIMREFRPVYTHADSGEVERLVAANTEFSRRHLAQLDEIQQLRAQLAERDALLRKELPSNEATQQIETSQNASRYLWLREHAVRIQGSQMWYQGAALDIRVDIGRDRIADQAKQVHEGVVLLRHQPE